MPLDTSPQTNPEVITVNAIGFAALVPALLPEGVWVNNITTGAFFLTEYVGGVMTLVQKGASGAGIAGAGTANRVTKFTAAGVVGDAMLTSTGNVVAIPDSLGAPIVTVNADVGARQLQILDEVGDLFVEVDALSAVRTIFLQGAGNTPMAAIDTGAVFRGASLTDENGAAVMMLDLNAVGRTVEFTTEIGYSVMKLFLQGASAAVRLGGPAGAWHPHFIFDAVTSLLGAFNTVPALTWQLNPDTGVVNTPAVSPAQMGNATENDYALATGPFNRLRAKAGGTSLTSIVAGADGSFKRIVNIGADVLTVQDSSAALGTAANRIITKSGAATALALNGVMSILYDATTQRWREV